VIEAMLGEVMDEAVEQLLTKVKAEHNGGLGVRGLSQHPR
jgi:hypothetical protein